MNINNVNAYGEHDHNHDHISSDDIDDHYEGYLDPITIGSVTKISHQNSGHFLHSHEIAWGSGSQQQSVTAYPTKGDTNSLWQIFPATVNRNFTHSTAIFCGEIIRLRHVNTKKWLHTHSQYRSPLSKKQEVTCFGTENESDSGDDWIVICNKPRRDNKKVDYWRRGESFSLQHSLTKHYLFTSKKSEFTNSNCRGCPILGQFEVSASSKKMKGCRWLSSHGVYFRPFDFDEDPSKYLYDFEQFEDIHASASAASAAAKGRQKSDL